MAEALAAVGITANFAGVIGAGIALSKSLYDFAHVLGSAADDVKSLATDVSLFCAVLKQVQSTLNQAKIYRLSISAIDTAQAVIDRCRLIFDDLDSAVTKLQGGKSKPDFLARVKWYFKEKRVLLIHEQLKTCGATLHLMLTTLQLAQKIASQKFSSAHTHEQDEQDRMMTHTLFIAQQAATERLSVVEAQLSDEENGEYIDPTPLTAGESHSSVNPWLKHRRNRSSQIIDGFVSNYNPPSAAKARPLSAILDETFNRLSLVRSVRYSHLSGVNDRRLSILQTDELLRQWTDQTDPLAAKELVPESESHREEPRSPQSRWRGIIEKYAAPGTTPYAPRDSYLAATNKDTYRLERTWKEFAEMYEDAYVKANPPSRLLSAIEDAVVQVLKSPAPPEAPPDAKRSANDPEILVKADDSNSEIFQKLKIGPEDPCSKVLRVALTAYEIQRDWTSYALYIVYDNLERCIGLDEKPFQLFKEQERAGKKPIFMLRKVGIGNSYASENRELLFGQVI